MKCSIEYITDKDVEKFHDLVCAAGFPRSLGYMRRMLCNPYVNPGTDVRGIIIRNDVGEPVGLHGIYFVYRYFKQERILSNSQCFMWLKPGYGACVGKMLGALNKLKKIGIDCNNCAAHELSFKIEILGGMKPGPQRCGIISFAYTSPWMKRLAGVWRTLAEKFPTRPRRVAFAMMPIAWLTYPIHCVSRIFARRTKISSSYKFARYNDFTASGFEIFWERFLSQNSGICSSREPKTMQWMFGDSLKAGKVILIAAVKDGQIEGFVLLRKYFSALGEFADIVPGLVRYKIVDICSVGNNNGCLLALVNQAVLFASHHFGATLEYIGGAPRQEEWLDPILANHHKLGFCTTTYKTSNSEIENVLKTNAGWFFGPYDGERCMGHGEYIDD